MTEHESPETAAHWTALLTILDRIATALEIQLQRDQDAAAAVDLLTDRLTA